MVESLMVKVVPSYLLYTRPPFCSLASLPERVVFSKVTEPFLPLWYMAPPLCCEM